MTESAVTFAVDAGRVEQVPDRVPSPPVASFDGVALGIHPAGAGMVVFATEKSTDSATQLLHSGAEIEVRAGSRAVVVRGLSACASYEAVRNRGVEEAQVGLDMLCASGVAVLVLDDIDSEHFAWWADSAGTVGRISSQVRLRIRGGLPTILLNGVPPPVPQPVWHESERYFRHAQATSDLFDAFRNLYLALESILSTLKPQQTEGEGAWFRRALVTAHGALTGGLAPFCADPSSSDPSRELYDELYLQIRNMVFHAKRGRPVLLPFDAPGRLSVQQVVERIAKLYLALLEHVSGVRFRTAFMFRGAFRAGYDAYPINRIYFSASEDPVDPNATLVPVDSIGVDARRAREYDEPWTVAFSASTTPADLAALPWVVKVVAAIGEEPAFAEDLEGRLDPSGLDRLEVVIAVRGENSRMVRTRYVS